VSEAPEVRIGTDIVSEHEVTALAENRAATEKYFSASEIDACNDRRQDKVAAFARCLAAKEALLKAAGRSLADLRQIEISHAPDGRPVASWNYLTDNGLTADISVSSSSPFAIAVAVIVFEPRSE